MRTTAIAFMDHILTIWEHCKHYSPAEGCSEDEISEIARAQNVDQLPEYYVEFMRRFGKKWNATEAYRQDYCYPDALSFKGPRGDSLWLNNLGIGHWFIFLLDRQVDTLFVFDPKEKNDPLVFHIGEGHENGLFKSVIEPYGRLSDVIIEWIEFCDR